ncbi:MAG: ferritin-like domain-containing protein, partial [Alphaproteobacteria bacterium]
GAAPDLTRPDFVPSYPAYLPDGETDFTVDLRPFSREAIETFLKIERPAILQHTARNVHHRPRRRGSVHAAHAHVEGEEHFYSIGEFYKAIEEGLEYLHAEMGDALFCGDPARQIGPEQYYSGGGGLIAVTDMASARAALELIAEQGEGVTDTIFDEDGEIAHYYRFQQIVLGRYYVEGDLPGAPSGGTFGVDWQAAHPVAVSARLSDYPEGSDLRAAAEGFNADYARFLRLLTRAFDGQPQLFVDAVGGMFRLKDTMQSLMRQPVPGRPGVHAAPTFEIAHLEVPA